jgi:ParB/RepB/Spo0J family partition protein
MRNLKVTELREQIRSKFLRSDSQDKPSPPPATDTPANPDAGLPPEPEHDPEIQDPTSRAQVGASQAILNSARAHLDKRRSEIYRAIAEKRNGPVGELLSRVITKIRSVPLDLIVADPEFTNLRLPPAPDELEKLVDSMRCEGLKVPVEVIPSPADPSRFHVRAGFRRTTAARSLGWRTISAIILPADTPLETEYWTNIIENSARDRLTSYEIAHAARTMRDRFKVRARDFAARAGYSESYVLQLLRCIDRLPDEIVEEWRNKAPIPVAMYDKWSNLLPDEAVAAMRVYCGKNPRLVGEWRPVTRNDRRSAPIRMASALGLHRMQRVRFAVEVARELDERSRKLCLAIVDFCAGGREDVPGIYDSRSKMRMYKSRRREDREPPATDLSELPPPGEPEMPDEKELP